MHWHKQIPKLSSYGLPRTKVFLFFFVTYRWRMSDSPSRRLFNWCVYHRLSETGWLVQSSTHKPTVFKTVPELWNSNVLHVDGQETFPGHKLKGWLRRRSKVHDEVQSEASAQSSKRLEDLPAWLRVCVLACAPDRQPDGTAGAWIQTWACHWGFWQTDHAHIISHTAVRLQHDF